MIEQRDGQSDNGSQQARTSKPAFRSTIVGKLIVSLTVTGAVLLLVGAVIDAFSPVFEGGGRIASVFFFVRDMTYASREDSLWTWYSVLLLAAVSGVFALHALLRRSVGARFVPYLLFAAAAAFMSVDESTLFHEKFAIAARLLGLSLPFTFTWLIIGIPFAIAAGFVLLLAARRIDALLRRRLIVAGVVFLLGAVGFEMVGGIIVNLSDNLALPGTRLLYQFIAMVEEGLEVAGSLIALWATLMTLDIRWTENRLIVGLDESQTRPLGTGTSGSV